MAAELKTMIQMLTSDHSNSCFDNSWSRGDVRTWLGDRQGTCMPKWTAHTITICILACGALSTNAYLLTSFDHRLRNSWRCVFYQTPVSGVIPVHPWSQPAHGTYLGLFPGVYRVFHRCSTTVPPLSLSLSLSVLFTYRPNKTSVDNRCINIITQKAWFVL